MRLIRFASDDHLVDRVRGGSAAAFETLFDRHHRPLLAFCRHMLGSAPDAEDAVQHTFMAAYADLMRSDKKIALRPWLYSIARHRCVSMLRARRERPVADVPEPEVDNLAAEVDTREELRATLADIALLPEDQRAALILAELGDLPHTEIAEIVGCRPEKVKALVFQARSSLANGRVARDTPCTEIREVLAIGGMAARRTVLRRHVRECDGCREFGELVKVQRRRVRVLLPVVPTLGLKRGVLGAALGSSGGGAATGVTALVGAIGVGSLAATAIVSVTVASSSGSPRIRGGDEATRTATAVHAGAAVTGAQGPRTAIGPDRPSQGSAPGMIELPGMRGEEPGPYVPGGHHAAGSAAAEPAHNAAEPSADERQANPTDDKAQTEAPGDEPQANAPAPRRRGDAPASRERGGAFAGHERGSRPDDPTGRAPVEPPVAGKPDDPPGKPAELPGGDRPDEPPGMPDELPDAPRVEPDQAPPAGVLAKPPEPVAGDRDPGRPPQ